MNLVLSHKTLAAVLALAIAAIAPLPTSAAERKVQHRFSPAYPELARRMHIEGTVQVEATVAPNGRVTSAKAVSGNTLLQSVAVKAIRKWKFEPESTRSTESVDVDFRLRD